jgi:hypothetical protein
MEIIDIIPPNTANRPKSSAPIAFKVNLVARRLVIVFTSNFTYSIKVLYTIALFVFS